MRLTTRDQTDEDAGDRLEHQREHGEADGHREGAGQNRRHRFSRERDAEVAAEDAADVDEVLHDERLVEVVLLPQLLDHRGVRRLVAEKGDDGVARHGEDHEVDEEGRPEEDGDRLEYASEDISGHGVVTSPVRAGCTFEWRHLTVT
jgi:hypothetical protein